MKHFLLFLLIPMTTLAETKDNPVEIGHVTWLRDHDQALALSKQTRKPVFVLFQEVPG
ncbi:MAG: hypothetical protein AAGC74_14345 [Verrucomicrobiota bacterium]